MKKIIIAIFAVVGVFSVSSCSDMLESDSSRQVFDPNINQKTDSVSYAMGIMKGMQAIADQYFFQGEMRGELVTTTSYTDNNLRQLANFTADTSNKYDSAYVYYNVINNCNYFLANRDTVNLYTGDRNTTINEFVSIAAIRAWAYMQLGRTYKTVPFFTEPLTEISKVENNDFPEYNLQQLVNALMPSLEQLSKNYTEDYLQVPDYSKYGASALSMGKTNFGVEKYINPGHLFIPLRIVMAEMYLETGEYQKAAENYFKYINYGIADNSDVGVTRPTYLNNLSATYMSKWVDIPSDYNTDSKKGDVSVDDYFMDNRGDKPGSWQGIFTSVNHAANPTDIITYIPMAVNKLNGTTTNIPEAFGYDYYASGNSSLKTLDEIQITPSTEYHAMADTTDYYYQAVSASGKAQEVYKSVKFGDGRLSLLVNGVGADSSKVWIPKNKNADVYLYRTTTIYLHLAEALNRMGYPDAAFCILKDGISDGLVDLIDTCTNRQNCYISLPTINMLRTTIPFLSDDNISNYPKLKNGSKHCSAGIHQHGAGLTIGIHTPYQFKSVVGAKINELNKKFNLNITNPTKQDTINAVEDLLCDEAAMELAFEGCRFYDLCRFARHKNSAGLYGSSFGTTWMAEKYRQRNLEATLKNEDNWYLPFK